MAETSARLLRLLSLLQTRRDWTGAELAERLNVAPRTIRRDIDRLRKIGYPVDADRGLAGGYRLGAGAELPPLLLEDDEAVAIAVGLRGATAGSVRGIEESSVRALAKLEQILPDRVRRKVSAIQGFTVSLPRRGPSIDANVLTTLSAACRDRDRVRFKYRTADGTLSTRKVEPVRLAHEGQRWYLLAFDNDRDDWRTFRVDRIGDVPSSAGRFARRPDPEGGIDAYMAKMMQPWTHLERSSTSIVRVHAPHARTTNRISPAYADSMPDGDDATILRLASDSTDWVAMQLIMATHEL
ncbi:MAG: YafY family protein, partial [Solirubrobacteraceae bacterium]|nr:YafY family protein [Solirubrobacteraceae bacterium]